MTAPRKIIIDTDPGQDDAVAALVSGVSFLKGHGESTGKVGAVGFCFGGGFTQLIACDFAIAADDATFGLSEVNWGIIPGGVVSWNARCASTRT